MTQDQVQFVISLRNVLEAMADKQTSVDEAYIEILNIAGMPMEIVELAGKLHNIELIDEVVRKPFESKVKHKTPNDPKPEPPKKKAAPKPKPAPSSSSSSSDPCGRGYSRSSHC